MFNLSRRYAQVLTFVACALLLLLGFFAFDREFFVFDEGPFPFEEGSPPFPLDIAPSLFIPTISLPAEPRVLLVSAFFPLAKSKHSLSDYESWFVRFLRPITTDIYFFCPPDVEPLIRSLRGDLPITIDTTYQSPYDVPPLQGLEEKYEKMHAWDKEKAYHSPGLYAVWNAKPFFLGEGLRRAEAAGAKYEFAFWNDAGSMRDFHTYTQWPNPRRVSDFFREAARESGTLEEELILFPWWWTPNDRFKRWKESDGPIDDTIAEGSFFGGMHPAIKHYGEVFYAYHNHWLSRSIFVGKDQMLMNALLFLYPTHFFGVLLFDTTVPSALGAGTGGNVNSALGACGSTWWFYHWWLADETEREDTADAWVQPGDGSAPRDIDMLRLRVRPKGSRRCRDTRLLIAYDLMLHQFGFDWRPPRATLSWVDAKRL